jgi:hypothetical protein
MYFLLSCLALFFIFFFFLEVFTKLRKATLSFVISVRLSVRMEQLGSHCMDFHEVWYLEDFSKVYRENSSFVKYDKNKGHLTCRPIYIFDHILLNSSWNEECFETNVKKKHILCAINFFENRTINEATWKNMVEPDRPQMIVWRMLFICWITKAANKHLEYVIRVAFPLQQWLLKRTSVLRYTYISCLVMYNVCTCTYTFIMNTLVVCTIVDFVRGH